jgi:uncharacterized membrane protein (UPF0182 family)
MPELRIVVLALQDRLAYGPTFEAALSSLFGSETPNLAESPGAPASTAATTKQSPAGPDISGLISEAARDFDDYQRLTAQGRHAEAGQKLDALKQILDELAKHPK